MEFSENDLREIELVRDLPLDDEEEGDGYELDDPKHPKYLENADMLRDRMRGK